MKNKRLIIILIGSISWLIISILAAFISTFLVKIKNNEVAEIDPEIKMSMQYIQVTDDEEFEKIDGTEYVKFGAYFTRDLNGDGIAEKMLGSCRSLNEKDVLFMDLNVLSNGYLKDGKITIDSSNFKYNMNMVKDSVLKYNYIKDDVKEIELKDVQNGTQKLILGDVVSNIGNNINNYSNKTYITLTGIHVADDSNHTETPISKTIEITVDWHGEINTVLETSTHSYNYDALNSKTISFNLTTRETHYKQEEQLILKDNVSNITIPELNGFAPEEVKCTNSGVNYEYDENTRILTITKESTVADDGTVTNLMPRSNSYTVAVTYPEEAYNSITTYTELKVQVSTYYYGYNNNSEQSEFANPIKSNVANGEIKLVFRETQETSSEFAEDRYTYNFYVNIIDKAYVSKPFYRYVISKQDILNLYDSDEEIKNKEYTIQWQAVRGSLGKVSSMIMSEPKSASYGDTWQNSVENKIMEEYTANTGIYFSGADGILGEDGTISIYNNDTNELIKTFTKEEWQSLSKENPFKYEEPVKHIRVETSSANANSSLSVYNIKELDVAKVLQNFTKEELKEIDKVHTYLKGTCNRENSSSENVTKEDYAYFIYEKSYTKMELETRKMSTQETLENEKIYIDAKYTQIGDAKWKDGIFIVEVPEEIINAEINSIETDNQNVKIVAYDLYKQNGKYLLKILTENSNPEEFRIIVNSNLTSDPTIKTKNVEFKLYAYNKYCNDYYYEIQDIYDIDGDNITEEKVGTSQNEGNTTMQLISPTNLVTLETVTDYDDEAENEETIAPNVALVENSKKQATINIKATNNYPYEVCDVKIIGKIPFTGNTYIINGKDMYSEFDSYLDESGISLPEELVNKATIYYSEKENPSLDLQNSENGWTTIVSDYSKIKSYLIDLNDYEMPKGKELSFSYKLNMPDDVSLNQVTFSNHAIYFSLKTEGGKLSLATEPNKVGVRIVKKFELDLTKYKKNSNLTIPGVTYLLKYDEKDIDDPSKTNEITRIITTNRNGKINLNDLYAEKTYKLKEIRVPDTCELNDEEIEFTVNADNTITMISQGNTSLKNAITYTNDIVKIDMQDEVKFDVEINKTKIGSNIKINNVRFKVQDENGNKKFANTVNGVAKIEGLSLNKTYTLNESSTPGNVAKNEGSLVFKLVRNNEGNITIQTISNTLASGMPTLEDLENNLIPAVKLNVENEIRYNLNLTKQDKADGSKLQGVKFKITGKGFGTNGTTVRTSNEGKIEIFGLYVGEEYSLEEINAEGYYLDSTKDNSIKFKVERNGSLQITKWQKGEGIDEVGEKAFTESTQDLNAELSVTLQNEKIPTYSLNLVKENEEGTKLKGAQFKLTSVDTGKSYTLTTDEEGKASFDGLYEYISSKSFVTGKYTLEEIYAPAGYAIDKTKLEFNAIRNNDGKVEIQITSGDSIIKEIDGVKQITSDENGVSLTILNKPVFSLKKTGDEGVLLPNAKFIITDLNGNLVTGTDGKIVGAPKDFKSTITISDSSQNPWIQNEDGVWVSKTFGSSTGRSILKSNEFTIDKKSKVNFDWTVSSYSVSYNYAWYKITNVNTNEVIGGEYQTRIGGTSYGTTYDNLKYLNVEQELNPGTYIIEFTYYKRYTYQSGTDSAYVKNLYLKPMNEDCYIETNEKGEISASVPQGLYKAVEVEAPVEYNLPENEENRTYYFGIGESKPEETEFTLSWNKTVSATGPVRIKDVIKDNDGNFVAVGSIYEDANIAGRAVTSKGDFDGIIVKFDQDGNIIWYKTVAGDGDDQLLTIAKDPTGGYVVAGYTSSSNVYYANGTDSIASASFGMEDAIFIKINNDGTFNHCKVIGGVGTDKINGIAVNNQGDIAVVGSYLSSDMYLNGDKNDSSSTITHSRKNGTEISPTDKKNAFISVYTNEGEYIWSQNILSSSTTANEAWASSVASTNSGFAVTCNINGNVYLNTAKSTQVSSTGNADGIVIHYTNSGNTIKYQKIAGSYNDELYDVIQDKDGNIVVVGSYSISITLGSKTHTSKREFDMIIAKFNRNLDYIDSVSLGGTADDSIKSISETDDGGYLLGGWYYSNAIDLDGDGTNDITANSGKSDGLILKLNNSMQMQLFEVIKGNGYDDIHGAIETDDGGIITIGSFDSNSISSNKKQNFASNTGYFDGLIAKFGQVVTAPEVPTAQKIEVQNNLKEFKITTEIGKNSDNERTGGTITAETIEGEENKKLVENVKYGYSNAKQIEIIPSENYQVVKITVNDEEIPFVADEQRKVTIPAEYFKDVKEDKDIVVIFEKDVKSLVVHHYLKDENGTYTTTKVSDDETISGKVDSNYITNAKMDLEDYELEKNAEGEYVIPQNASGTFSDSNEDVTYYYEARKYTLEVNHYLDGTENKLTESSVTKHIKGYEYETSKSNDVLQDYNFVYVDGKEQGTLTEDKVVNYFYQKKEYTITTEIIPNSETGILGGTITGEYNNTYKEENGIRYVETVKKNETSTETIEIVPDFGYKVKTITLESTDENENKTSKVIYGENKDANLEVQAVEDENGKITLTKFNSVTENKHIKVEFEAIENSIIVHHYLKDKNNLTTKKVAQDEIIKVQVGQENQISPKENIPNLHLAKNSDGTDMLPKAEVNNETGIIEVSYYYEPDDITLVLSHYLADTNEKLVEDEVITTTPNMIQDENGYYTVIEELNYTLEDNENYKTICNDKYLTSIAGNYNKSYEIGENLEYTFKYNSNSEIKYFYKEKGTYEYIVNYYYDGVQDVTKTENKTIRTGDTISTYTDNNITGYKLEKAKITNKNNEEVDLPYLVTNDLNRIVLNVYYVKDTFNYKVKYFYNGLEDESKEKNLQAEYGSQISNYPEENKEGYVLYYAKAINANSEETDLPLTITEDESKNIINVYYAITRTFEFKKQWNNIPEADVNNYRSTFKLKKTINGVTTDYTDISGNILTRTIIGNGEAKFENIIAYDRTNKIEYSVEEIKVEKTIDGGNTWKELSNDEYKFVNKYVGQINKVKVGDYINYNPASGSGAGLTFKSSQAKTGTNITGTFNSSDLNTWRVLSIDDDKIKIIPAEPTSQKVTLDGAYGYINSEAMLNEISSIYGKGKGAISARSLTAEDLEEYFKFNKNEFENSNSNTGLYGGSKEYTSGSFVVNNQVVSGPQTIEQGSYYYEARSYNYSAEENADGNMIYNMIFKNIDTTANPFWLATKGADLQASTCRFDVLNISNGYVGRTHLYTSNGSGGNSSLRVMPVVTLDDGIDVEKDENGVWQLVLSKNLADVAKVGDYVNYNPASGNGAGLSFTPENSKYGTSITGTFNSSDLSKWRVFSIKEGKVQIIPTKPTTQTVKLNGSNGYINSEEMLDGISAIYGKGDGAVSARSLTAEDLEEYFKFNKNEFENSYSSTGLYGGTRSYSSGTFIVNDEIVTGAQTITQGSYYYAANDYKYSASENEDANKAYNMLFVDINTGSNPYWLATKGADLQASTCRFDVLNGSNGYVGRTHLYTSNGGQSPATLGVLPVVTLELEINGEKDENGAWTLVKRAENNFVENTLNAKYAIKKEWKLKNPSNYKATFKLMKTVDGVTSEVADDSGSIITKTITGNGTVTFTDLKPYEDEKAVTYSAVETKVEKTEDNWATSNEVDMDLFIITHKEEAGFDDVIVNSLNNKFSLDINITEDTESMPLDGIEFTISIKDEQENNILTENKTYTSGTNGNLIEIANELPIDSDDKTFTVTITQNTSKEGYRKIQTPVTFTVTSKLADNGISYVLVPENKDVTNTKGVEVEENSILVKLQNSYIAEYEVHYFYDGVENVDAKESYDTTVGEAVENYESKPQGMVLEKAKALNAEGIEADLPLTVRKDKTNNIINVYYRTQYKITTKVNKHDEKYTNKTETNVAGGTISGEGQNSYENVFKGEDSTKQIKITPNAGYVIVSVKVNGEEKLPELTEKINATDGSLTLAVTGGTNIAGGYFTEMQEDKEVEVEFRKKTKITVKYLEKETKAVLAEEKVINGLEGDTFGKTDEKHIIDRVAVNNYKEATVTAVKRQGGNIDTEISGEIVDGVIKEAFAEIKQDENGKKYAKGTMFADEITLIYWYEKIPTGVWVRHVEIDEVSKVNGEKTELKPVEKLTFTEDSKEVLREEFEGYVSVNCPNNMTPLVNGLAQEGNVVAKSSEDSKTVTYSAGTTVEVWFFYEKEHKITTEVVPHKETINGVQKDVEGGTISKNYKIDDNGNVTDEEEDFFEKVLHRGNSSKKIEIVPQEGYQIKQILIGDEEQDLELLVKEDGTASFDVGAIKDIKKDVSVKVEFEKIPAKVIVKYIDIETNEEIVESKEVNGFVGDTYNEERPTIEGYKKAGNEPINAGGTMKKEPTTVNYYYQRLRKIKTEVKLHEETKEGKTVMAKGGAISGDGLDVYEYVEKGNSSTKEIKITPQNGYTIKSVKVNNVEQEIAVNEDGTCTLPQFTNVTEDINVVVEFAQIPAKVKVLYLETVKQDGVDVEKEIAEQDVKNVFINDEYKTEPKLLEFYKLIETKMPENKTGVVTEDEITVKYYYEKLPFNLKVVKEISNIMLNDEKQEVANSSKAKVEIKYRKIKDIKLEISYRIKVTNTEKIAGKARLEEIVPNGFELVQDANGRMWTKDTKLSDIAKIVDGTEYTLETGEIKPGETKEYVVTLKWNPNVLNSGTKTNVAQIAETINSASFKETILNDNISEAKLEIVLNYQSENGENNNNNESENGNNNNSGGENNSGSENNNNEGGNTENNNSGNNSASEENNNNENNGTNSSEAEKTNNQENNGTNNQSNKAQNTNVKETTKVPQTGQTRAIYAGLSIIIVLSIAGIVVLSKPKKEGFSGKGKH